jgi:uncharacterized OB-fold protein
MATSVKPIPVPSDADRPFWDGTRAHRLVLSRCDRCGWCAQRSQLVCPNCRGEAFTWSEVSGRGTIWSYTVAHQTWTAGFEDELPYVVVAVAIEEQPSLLLVTDLVGDFSLDELDVGLPVRAAYEPRGDETLLQFELARDADVRR